VAPAVAALLFNDELGKGGAGVHDSLQKRN